VVAVGAYNQMILELHYNGGDSEDRRLPVKFGRAIASYTDELSEERSVSELREFYFFLLFP
jgi:hypothetical protein